MLFPDETNLRHVASALWKNPDGLGQASVIVGAGFSKNALTKSGSSYAHSSFPSWAELTDAMVEELYSHESVNERNNRKNNISGAVSSALRIAEEYEAARGRGQLDSLLKRAIPDLDFDYGPLHSALCELPWVDILTTNYDTLLERAANEQLERRYQVVMSQQDIPTTQQPRIIKLHGSFPDSKQPNIITEEDFRTYENKFPAMVNLAQQCLIEKTCCLIGFSGDDPNFLRWSGWVRDVLGSSHMEPVYLVGLNNHSPSQKSLLDRRHIRTIDLSPLFPSKDWPNPAQRHQAATTWFIEALKSLKPAETFEWPKDTIRRFTNLKIIDKNPELPHDNNIQFKEEFDHPHLMRLENTALESKISEGIESKSGDEIILQIKKENKNSELDFKIDNIVEIWKNNRALYPGWLVLPWSNHQTLIEKTISWGDIIPERALVQDNQQRALKWLLELTWRLEKALSPWSSAMIECIERIIERNDLGPDPEKPQTVLAFQLLRAFREDGRENKFLALRERLLALSTTSHERRDFIYHQTVLLHLENWRIRDALKELLEWDTKASDSLWKAKRAALIGEFRPDLAREDALTALRSLQSKPDLSDLYARSREAYVLWLSTVLINWGEPQRQIYEYRRREIQRKSFDAFNFEERLNETLQAPPRADVSRSDLLNELKPGQSQITRAYTMRRYIEETAGLISGPGFTVYANSVKRSIPWMAISDPEEALRFSVRHRSSSERECTFPSHMLAALSSGCISKQIEGLLDTLDFLLNEPMEKRKIRSSGEQFTPSSLITEEVRNHLLSAATVHGSRLNEVLTHDQRVSFVQILLKLRRAGKAFDWQTLRSIEEAIHDVLPSLSQEQLAELSLVLLQQPITGHEGFPATPVRMRDVIVSASFRNDDNFSNLAQSKNSELIPVIESLLATQKGAKDFTVRWNATLRLAFFARQNFLSSKHLAAFKRNLKIQIRQISENIPVAMQCEAFHPADLLTFTVGNKDEHRKIVIKIISNTDWPNFLQKNEKGVVESISHLSPFKDPSSLASELTVQPWFSNDIFLQPSEWAKDQVLDFLNKAQSWIEEEGAALADREKEIKPNDIFSRKGEITWRFERISKFCNNVALLAFHNDEEVLRKTADTLCKIDNLIPVYTVKFCPILIKSGQVDASAMTARIRNLYASNDVIDKFTALMAVAVWAVSYSRVGIDPPPRDLVFELAVMIRTRRAPDLGWALDIARIVVKQCSELINTSFYDDILIGLSYLCDETKPRNPQSGVLGQNASLSDLRVSALLLLKDLPPSGSRDEIIKKWKNQNEDENDWRVKIEIGNFSEI